MKRILVLMFIGLLLVNCGSKRRVTERESPREKEKTVIAETMKETRTKEITSLPSKPPSNIEAYISIYSDIAQNEMKLYDIPASITLAQGILESGSGKGRLAREANNHFGIKCHEWAGARIYHDDDKSQECFRKYKEAKYSFRDHSLFLLERRRYSGLFELRKDDYKRWAKGLRAAGYATDKKYPDKLISLIERYELYKFDDVYSTQISNQEPNEKLEHVVVKGDTLYSISKRFDLTVEELQELNNLKNNELKIGQVLTLTPKHY